MLAKNFGVKDERMLSIIGRIAEAELEFSGCTCEEGIELFTFRKKSGQLVKATIQGL